MALKPTLLMKILLVNITPFLTKRKLHPAIRHCSLPAPIPKFWSNGIDLEWLITKPANYLSQFAFLLDKLYLRFAY